MFEFTQYPEQTYIEMKMAITTDYSKEYGVPLDDVVDLFVEKGVYEMLDDGRDLYIMRMCPYMVEYVYEYLHPDPSEQGGE